MKKSERQIYIMLLLVTFAFLFLDTPFYIWAFLFNFYKSTSPRHRAGLVLLHSVASAAMYINCGINFFLYVVSDQKFRADLINLFPVVKVRNIPIQYSQLKTQPRKRIPSL